MEKGGERRPEGHIGAKKGGKEGKVITLLVKERKNKKRAQWGGEKKKPSYVRANWRRGKKQLVIENLREKHRGGSGGEHLLKLTPKKKEGLFSEEGGGRTRCVQRDEKTQGMAVARKKSWPLSGNRIEC